MRGGDDIDFGRYRVIRDLSEECDEDQEVLLSYLLHVVNRPTRFAREALDVEGDHFTRLIDDHYIYGLLVAQGERLASPPSR